MKKNLIFLLKLKLFKNDKFLKSNFFLPMNFFFLKNFFFKRFLIFLFPSNFYMDSENKIDLSKKRKKQDSFLYLIIRILKLKKLKKIKYVFEKNYFLLLSKFLITFLGSFFKKKIIFFLKKGSNLLHIKKVSSNIFYKIFKKYLKINKNSTAHF